MIFSEQVTIVRPGRKRGDYGGWVDDWDNPTEIPVEYPVSVQPLASQAEETTTDRAVTDSYRLYTPPPHQLPEDVVSGDRLRVDSWGITLIFDGNPLRWRTQILPHTEADLVLVRGARK